MPGRDPAAAPGGDPVLVRSGQNETLEWRGVAFYPAPDPAEYARRKARVTAFPPGDDRPATIA